MLELFEDKDRDEQRALDEARVADIGDAAIDNDTRIEQLVGVRIGCRSGLCRLPWRCVRSRAHLPHLRESFMKRGTKSKSPVSSRRFLIVIVMPRYPKTMLKMTGM